jgi:quercetin dioxygenase-like cupin family protein
VKNSIVCLVSGITLVAGCASHAPRPTAVYSVSSTTPPPGEGVILQQSEGERRVRRLPPTVLSTLTSPVILKVDRRNGGSPDFVMFTEDIPPGQAIAPHHHEHADEILFIHRGTGVVELGSRSATVATGATIYIPPNTRVSLRNNGTEPLSIIAIFAKPGFDDFLRALTVPEGEHATPLTVDELSRIRARYRRHIVYDRQ